MHGWRELGKDNTERTRKEQSREFLPVKMSVTMEKILNMMLYECFSHGTKT